jgi:hypothetical protein
MSVVCVVRRLCDGPIPRAEEYYRTCVSLSVISVTITPCTYNEQYFLTGAIPLCSGRPPDFYIWLPTFDSL